MITAFNIPGLFQDTHSGIFPKLSSAGEEIDILEFEINKSRVQSLKQVAIQSDADIKSLFLALFYTLIHRNVSEEEFGIHYLWEEGQELQLALAPCLKISGSICFNRLMQDVKINCDHAVAPTERTIQKPETGHSKNPLLQTVLAWFREDEAFPIQEKISGLLNEFYFDYRSTFLLLETESGLEGKWIFNPSQIQGQTVQRLIEHFKNLISEIIADPGKEIGSYEILSEEEIKLIEEFNDTAIDYHAEKTLTDLFEEQALLNPQGIALRQGAQTMDYKSLNERANKLAWHLKNLHILPGDNIGILTSRNFEMIIGMMAILKAGGAYVPIDPQYPLDRQEYIFHQSSIKLILSDGHYEIGNNVKPDQFILLNDLILDKYSPENLRLKIDSRQLAYTIYTSGSTGRPKGVMIEHHSAVNLISCVNRICHAGPGDRLLFITSMCFDLSVYDIFGILAAGGTICVAKQEEVSDLQKLPELIEKYQISFWDSVPSTMEYVMRTLENAHQSSKFKSLRMVFMSGDWINVSLPDRIKKFFPNTQVVSLGGATEGTVWSNFFPVERVDPNWNSIPYGRPLDNNTLYILNEQQSHVPIGVMGEFYVGGVGVARGYARDEEKTDFAFRKDPFRQDLGGRMYRTGDLGRMLPDMNMEFIGRKDDQVKIRGFRVELGEIESNIRQSGMVTDVVVLAKEDNERIKKLVVYTVPQIDFNKEQLMDFLKSRLPEYMVPSLWKELEALPLTSNGKIDKKALPPFDFGQVAESGKSLPRDQKEKELRDIWEEVLRVKIGIDDNFFALGGHSLSAVQILSRVDRVRGVKLPLSILFKCPTVRELHDHLNESCREKSWTSLVPIKTSGNKTAVYIVHGDGLNVLNLSDVAGYVDAEQPVYGLQPKGLNEKDEPLDNMKDIAALYISEILQQNPKGPYALAGYSFGGYVAIEMRKQLVAMGKKVIMLGIFDTNADNIVYKKDLRKALPMKMKRQMPKFLFVTKSLISHPRRTAAYQFGVMVRKVNKLLKPNQSFVLERPANFNLHWDKIYFKHEIAFRNYHLEPFDGELYLFKAKEHLNFVDDERFLGWAGFARKGVKVFEVPGDHKTMLEMPHAIEFAQSLQKALDQCS